MNRRRGFSLVELLVVISIIALLISILLPSLGEARRKAKVTVCGSNEHQIGIALMHYAGDHRDRLPYPGEAGAIAQMLYIMYNPVNNGGPPAYDGFNNLGLLQPNGYMAVNSNTFHCSLTPGRVQSNGNPSHSNALPNVNGQTLLPADLARYKWLNLRSAYYRRWFSGEAPFESKNLQMLGRIAFISDVPTVQSLYDTSGHGNRVNVLFTDGAVLARPVDRAVLPVSGVSAVYNPIIDLVWIGWDR